MKNFHVVHLIEFYFVRCKCNTRAFKIFPHSIEYIVLFAPSNLFMQRLDLFLVVLH